MSKHVSILSRMFASYAKDTEVTPEEVADAAEELQAMAVESPEEKGPEETAPKSAGDEDMPVTTPASDDRLDRIISMLEELLGKGKDAEPEPEPEAEVAVGEEVDPLAKLEDDLTELEAMKAEGEEDAEPEEAESNFVDPEEINESEDEDPEEEVPNEDVVVEEEVKDKKGCDTAPIRVAIDALKPILAALPENVRKQATDAATKALRKSVGLDEKPKQNEYSAIKKARKAVGANDADLAKRIMEKRNPNYKG